MEMDMNDYYMHLYVQSVLAEARAAAAQRALRGPERPVIAPIVRAAIAGAAGLYGRWSSATSTASKPAAARAWSRSR
jgi:hypothetical protein